MPEPDATYRIKQETDRVVVETIARAVFSHMLTNDEALSAGMCVVTDDEGTKHPLAIAIAVGDEAATMLMDWMDKDAD